MAEKPLLMSGELVRATLAGLKDVTRRPINPQPPHREKCAPVENQWVWYTPGMETGEYFPPDICRKPRFHAGDVAWVRETWARSNEDPMGVVFRADDDDRIHTVDGTWRPSIHMPRWACRLRLKILNARPERLQEITEAEAKREGVEPLEGPHLESTPSYLWGFERKWEEIYGKGAWARNGWVWRYEYEVEK